MAQTGSMPPISDAKVRIIILHVPGPLWDSSIPPMDQTGIPAHFDYLQQIGQEGKIEYAGPFLHEGQGGMILASEGMTLAEAQVIGENDPAVMSGLIRFEVREWMLTIRHPSA